MRVEIARIIRIWAVVVCATSASIAQDYPLKNIAKDLSQSRQVSSPSLSHSGKKLLENTRGIVNYQSANTPLLKQKLKSRDDLVIRIIGDSHVGGDFISHRLRGLLFKSSLPGFIYPLYPSYHQNIPLKFESEHFELFNSRVHGEIESYPLGGIVIKPSELPARLTITPQSPITHKSTTKILFKSSNKKEALLLEDSQGEKFAISAKTPHSWQILSLSLSYPLTLTARDKGVEIGGFYIYDAQNSRVVENLGINGARSDLWLKWDKPLFSKQLSLLPADLFILCYGSNDALYETFKEAEFLKNYGELIDIIREANPNASILLLSPPPVVQKASGRKKSSYKSAPNAKAVKAAIAKLAKSKQTMLFDLEEFIKESGGKKSWESANLAKSDVHLLPLGYKLVADKIYYELERLK